MSQGAEPVARLHRARLPWHASARMLIVRGLAGLALVLAGLALLLTPSAASPAARWLGVPVLAVGGAVAALAWARRRATREVLVDDDGLHLVSLAGTRLVRWDDIARSWGTGQMASEVPALELFDSRGATLALFTDSLERLEELAAEVRRRTGGRGEEANRRAAARRAGWTKWLVSAAGFTLVLRGLLDAGAGLQGLADESRLRSEGVVVQALVLKRWLAPEVPREWIAYVVTGDDGQRVERAVAMQEGAWKALAGQDRVAVRYVPGEPSISRLVKGEETVFGNAVDPRLALLLAGGKLLVGLCVIAGAFVHLGGLFQDGPGGSSAAQPGRGTGFAG